MGRKIGAKYIVRHMCPEWYRKIIMKISAIILLAGLASDGRSEKTDRMLPGIPPLA